MHMRIAFTHNLQLTTSEAEAEFDTPETVHMITDALRALGHEVEPVEVSGNASRVVARLEALNPDLCFNTAEGTHGRFREAFYPALFDRLGLPFTGSDAYTCALTLDKQLTKMVLDLHGVPSPKGVVVTEIREVDELELRYPVIMKPNYEGSSMGITTDSVVESKDELHARIQPLLARYAAGILLEEFIVGRDLVVPFVENVGVLEPAVYDYDPEVVGDRKYQIYDFELKTTGFEAVQVKVPADIAPEQRQRVIELSRIVFRELGIRDAGRIDFRIAPDGEIFFLEINALPSLEAGASIYSSGKLVGLDTTEKVMAAICESAAERYGLALTPTPKRRRAKLNIGLIYNLKDPSGRESVDEDAEFDSPDTIRSIRDAIESYGHQVTELEASPELPSILPASGLDLVFNIAEGVEGRAREAQVPALLELLGIEYTGSDPTALSLALDKGLAKRLVRQAGFLTPTSLLMVTGKERLPKDLQFPVILKPVHEGSSKGILATSVVESEDELREQARNIAETYKQAVLVESYLSGREFTVAMLGEKRPKVLPILEVVFLRKEEKYPVYSFHTKFKDQAAVRYDIPAQLTPAETRTLERASRGIFSALGCRDFARVDFRMDAKGRPHFIECNPLPGLAPGFSDFCLIAEAAGLEYRVLVGEILSPALRRHRERKRQRLLASRV